MKSILFIIVFLLFAGVASAADETFTFGPFGKVNIIRKSDHPSQVVLFVSGDGGWNLGVVDMANELAQADTLVAGIDITHYLNKLEKEPGKCLYPASDFEALSQFIQKKYKFPKYIQPILVGYSSGATLVMQSFPSLLQTHLKVQSAWVSALISLSISLFAKGAGLECSPIPKGKGYDVLPAKHLETPWIALQGTIDQVCNPEETEDFVKAVKGVEIVILPKVGHGYSVPRNWLPSSRRPLKNCPKLSR